MSFDRLTGTAGFLVVGDGGRGDKQGVVDLTKEVAGGRRPAEVDRDTVGPHQTPALALLRRVVDRPVRHVLAERVRSTDGLLERKRTTYSVDQRRHHRHHDTRGS